MFNKENKNVQQGADVSTQRGPSFIISLEAENIDVLSVRTIEKEEPKPGVKEKIKIWLKQFTWARRLMIKWEAKKNEKFIEIIN